MVELWATCGRMDTPFPPVSVQAWIGSCSRTGGAEVFPVTEKALVIYRASGGRGADLATCEETGECTVSCGDQTGSDPPVVFPALCLECRLIFLFIVHCLSFPSLFLDSHWP